MCFEMSRRYLTVGLSIFILAAWTLFMMWNATQGGMHGMQH